MTQIPFNIFTKALMRFFFFPQNKTFLSQNDWKYMLTQWQFHCVEIPALVLTIYIWPELPDFP